jgi:HD superfamily phosphohydrolase
MLARYFMFAQVYCHPVRLAYNEHLQDFLGQWLPEGRFPVDVAEHLHYCDVEVLAAIHAAAQERAAAGHDAARRIVERDHFRIAYHRHPDDIVEATRAIAQAAGEEFGAERIRYAASPRRAIRPTSRSTTGMAQACPRYHCPRC